VRSQSIHSGRAIIALAAGLLAAALGLSTALGDGRGHRDRFAASQLTLRQLAGQRIVAGFNGTSPPKALRKAIANGDLAGVILFSRNVPDHSTARSLINRLQAIKRPRGLRAPLLVMIDQEGGEVKRLSGAPTASAQQMGKRGGAFSRDQGTATASNLRGVGVNVDLAPVLDVGRPGGAISSEHRSFGSSAGQVSSTAIPFAAALQSGGVAATGKHFPGLGAAGTNTDLAAQTINLSRDQLRSIDEKPYESLISHGGDLVMLSVATYPAFSDRPAALAAAIATGELRQHLGFNGVSVSDSLESAAAQAFGGPAKVAVAGAKAGTDLLLFGDFAPAARADAALKKALRAGSLARTPSEESVQRVLDLRAKLPSRPSRAVRR
jgi:beta-N-acetylhexosaminidase